MGHPLFFFTVEFRGVESEIQIPERHRLKQGPVIRVFYIHVVEFANFSESFVSRTREKASELEDFSPLSIVSNEVEQEGYKKSSIMYKKEKHTRFHMIHKKSSSVLLEPEPENLAGKDISDGTSAFLLHSSSFVAFFWYLSVVLRVHYLLKQGPVIRVFYIHVVEFANFSESFVSRTREKASELEDFSPLSIVSNEVEQEVHMAEHLAFLYLHIRLAIDIFIVSVAS
ncbi:hypothetical protein SSX86_006326 [Deinandra increscens subsp. villosa]|uniref:Uncharacterized protein n=1 Tax=Deinandra increscens subsp. villosa TaxID=3103831 RepID=A0AAP0DJ86_9ASTR